MKKIVSVLSTVLIICISQAALGTTWYVDSSVPESGDGASWETALKTIQEGINIAWPGDEVIVAEGTYKESLDFLGKAITVRSTDPTDRSVVEVTVIDADEAARVVTFNSGEGYDSVLSGFTITGGLVSHGDGAGILCDGSSPTIENNIIDENEIATTGGGGGICCIDSSAVIRNNRITRNWIVTGGGSGGGIYISGGSPEISDNIVMVNSAGLQGGGIYCSGGSPQISDNVVGNNSAGSEGGGIYCFGGSLQISDNEVSDNSAGSEGGGICLSGSDAIVSSNTIFGNLTHSYGGGICCLTSSPVIEVKHNIIYRNGAFSEGGGIYCTGSETPLTNNSVVNNQAGDLGGGVRGGTVSNCIVWGNVASDRHQLYGSEASYSCIQDGYGGEGNLPGYPHFADMGMGDYHLEPCSPCIDTGDPTSDYSNEPEPNGGRVNMGAFGNTPEATSKSPDTDADGLRDAWEIDYFGNLHQDGSGDPDGDGIPTEDEYLYGSDPMEPPPSYEEFNTFCIESFGAENEELAYEMFGQELQFVDEGFWLYESEVSADIGFETNLPAKTHVEYGETTNYGYITSEPERHFYVHLHYLKDLQPDTTYHYRLVAIDERGNEIASDDKTLMTKTFPNAVHIPDDMEGPPYILDSEGTTYVVTQDLTIDGLAFDITANNVTLDLGGNTVIYDNVHMVSLGGVDSSFGVKTWGYDLVGARVFNGIIRQGAGNHGGNEISLGCNPMFFDSSNAEAAGTTIIYSGPQLCGIYNECCVSNSEFHHNVFVDEGHVVNNRHGVGCRALYFHGSDLDLRNTKIHHNLVKRSRQMGLTGTEVYNNEIYIDSWATNSFGIVPWTEAYGNKVFGRGYHVVGIDWNSKLRIEENYIHLQGLKPTKRSPEYGRYSSINGIRLTQYVDETTVYEDNLYEGNVVVVKGQEGSLVRGVQFSSDVNVKNLRFVNNVVKAIAQDQETEMVSCIVTHGYLEALPITYENNVYISNMCNVRFGDYYLVGSNHHFISDKFVKVSDDSRYRTFLFDSPYPCKNHIIRDPVFDGGASLDSVSMGTGDHDFTVQWTLTVKTEPGATVVIEDKTGEEVFSGEAGIDGTVSIPLSQYIITPAGKTFLTPHIVTVSKACHPTKTETVDMNEKKELMITLELSEGEYWRGDVNGDYVVDSGDAMLIRQVELLLRDVNDPIFEGPGFDNGDISEDGICDTGDAMLIRQAEVGLRPPYLGMPGCGGQLEGAPMAGAGAPMEGAAVSITSPYADPEPGDKVALSLDVDVGDIPLGVYTMEVKFDPAVIIVDSIEGGATPEFSVAPLTNPEHFTSGIILLNGVNETSLTSPTGRVNVARITFGVVGAPGESTSIDLRPITLRDTSAQAIPVVSVVGGSVRVFQDSDNDALPDGWELEKLGGLYESADDDHDHDGCSNYQEYVAGTDPADARSFFTILKIEGAANGEAVQISWQTEKGRVYSLYWTDGSCHFEAFVWKEIPDSFRGTGGVLTFVDDGTNTFASPGHATQEQAVHHILYRISVSWE